LKKYSKKGGPSGTMSPDVTSTLGLSYDYEISNIVISLYILVYLSYLYFFGKKFGFVINQKG